MLMLQHPIQFPTKLNYYTRFVTFHKFSIFLMIGILGISLRKLWAENRNKRKEYIHFNTNNVMKLVVHSIVVVVLLLYSVDWMVPMQLHLLMMEAVDDDGHVYGYVENVVPMLNVIEMMIVLMNFDWVPNVI